MKLAFVFLLQVCLGLVQLDFERVRAANSQNAHRLIKRHGVSDLEVSFENYVFVADLEVGSDKNKISVLIDTTSADTTFPVSNVLCYAGEEEEEDESGLFVAASDNQARHENHDEEGDDGEEHATATTCTDHGSFETGKSSSWKADDSYYVAPDDSDYYYFGVYGSDTVYFNDEKLDNVTIIALNETNAPYGILGLGLSSINNYYHDESNHDDAPEYPTFIDVLADQGLIEKKLFSLYLNHPSTLTGSVLFGGVDYAKVDGSLTTVPMLDVENSTGYQISLSGVDLVIEDKSFEISKVSYPALIYSSSPLSTLPESVYENLGKSLNGTLNDEFLYFIDCPANDDSTKVKFDFSGAKIEVPLGDLVIPNKEGDRCLLGVFPDSDIVLGQNILRSAYIVFDIENSEVSLGQVKYTDDTKISTISESIPSATPATATGTNKSSSDIVATSVLSYATGIKSFNSVDALFVSEMFRENAAASGSAKPSGSNSSKTSNSDMAAGSGDAASSSAPKSSSSQGDASSSAMKVSFILSTVFAGMLVIL